MMTRLRILLLLVLATAGVAAQTTPDRLLRAAKEPQNWLTYSGKPFVEPTASRCRASTCRGSSAKST